MELRTYRSSDCEALAELFYQTVHTVNCGDYTREQLDAWATGTVDLKQWDRSFRDHTTLIALEGDTIVGFGDLDRTGYLDRLYVHKDHQRQGVATFICQALESSVETAITTHASITAKPFFEQRGYQLIQEQQVERHGVWLTNFVMKKER